MRFVPVYKRIRTHEEGKCDHPPFKINIVDYIDAEERQACKDKGQHNAVYGAGHRCCNSQSVPVDLKIHSEGKDNGYLQ